MQRVEILYDFDFGAEEYYERGLNHHPSKRFSRNEEVFNPIEEIKKRNNIESLYLLGSGLDKVCISESSHNQCFVIEPCSAMFFICSIEEVFKFFTLKKSKGEISILNGGINISESSFRSFGERGEDELHIGITFELIDDDWKIGFGKIGKEQILNLSLDSFLAAYFEFAERMIRFYDNVLPEYKEFKYQYPLFIKAVRDSVIMEEFKIKPQSSYDDLTYYDYQ